jgi:hypothetical protein
MKSQNEENQIPIALVNKFLILNSSIAKDAFYNSKKA